MFPLIQAGPSRPARAVLAAIAVLAVVLLAVGGSRPAAAASGPSASSARLTPVLRTLTRTTLTQRRLSAHVRRACRGRHTAHCEAHRRTERALAARVRRLRRQVRQSTPTASTTTTTTRRPAPAPATPAPAAPAPATSAAPVNAAGYTPGVVAGRDPNLDVASAVKLGARVVRVEFAIGSSADTIAPLIGAYAAKGIRVQPLAGFYGRLPTVAEAQNLAGWVRAFGPGGTFWAGRSDGALAIQRIEFGNETSYPYQGTDQRGGEYALRFRDAQMAIQAVNPAVGLLAQGDDQDGTWFDQMFAAVPDLGSRVAGWTLHPYGQDWWNDRRIGRLFTKTAQYGAPSTIPVDVTEWGLATDDGHCLTDNYGWDPCMTYAAAATKLLAEPAWLNQHLQGRLRSFFVYQVRDQADPGTSTDREAYFGLLRHDLSDKPGLTEAARTVFASTTP